MQFAIDELGLKDNLLFIVGDNLLDFSLTGFISYFQEKNTTVTMRYWEESEAKLHKTGVAVVGDNDKIIDMEEKPAQPKSHWCTPPFYIYKSSDYRLAFIRVAVWTRRAALSRGYPSRHLYMRTLCRENGMTLETSLPMKK